MNLKNLSGISLSIKLLIIEIMTSIQNILFYKFKSLGKGCRVVYKVNVNPNSVELGDYCFINKNCNLSGNIIIGNFVMFAQSVAIIGGDHKINIPGVPIIFSGRDISQKVVIGDDVWIGHGSIILHGITIGEGAVVAAGSVVTKDILPYTINAGVPAVRLRERFSEDEIMVHKKVLIDYRKTGKLVTCIKKRNKGLLFE